VGFLVGVVGGGRVKLLRKSRRGAYRYAALAGDVNAIARGPKATVARFLIRKPAYRLFGRLMRKLV
jgi:hypothetical protein